ncbi:DUF6480 family protein [Streptomyces sp. NPDC002742]|uniref:DUF6480 family protein n=1 Tax=Streptomyces sp. NPDC002742 TaxID=3364663 RepID=UPI0036A8D5C0
MPRHKKYIRLILRIRCVSSLSCPRHTDPTAAWRSARRSCVCSDVPSPSPCTPAPSRPRTSRTASASPSRSTRRPAREPGSGPSCWTTSPATGPHCRAPPPAICSSWRRCSPAGTGRTRTTSRRSARCAATPPRQPSWTAAGSSPSRTCAPGSRVAWSPRSRRPAPGCWPCPAAAPPTSPPRSPSRNRSPGHRPGRRVPSGRSPPRARSSRRGAGPDRLRRTRRSNSRRASYSGAMDYVSALVPPVVMAVFFIGLIVTIVKSQGGANKAKEDGVVDAALARVDAAQQASAPKDAGA